MIVADTDVLIDAMRGQEPIRTRIAECIGSGIFGTTAVTAFELLAGARSRNERSRVESLLAAATVLALDAEAAREAAAIHRELAADGRSIGTADSLIAGICRMRSFALLTRNRGHFERVNGLRIASLEP